MLTDVNITSLLLQSDAELETLDCRVIEMPALMRALLVETLGFNQAQRNIKREQAILQLLRGELPQHNVFPVLCLCLPVIN